MEKGGERRCCLTALGCMNQHVIAMHPEIKCVLEVYGLDWPIQFV